MCFGDRQLCRKATLITTRAWLVGNLAETESNLANGLDGIVRFS